MVDLYGKLLELHFLQRNGTWLIVRPQTGAWCFIDGLIHADLGQFETFGDQKEAGPILGISRREMDSLLTAFQESGLFEPNQAHKETQSGNEVQYGCVNTVIVKLTNRCNYACRYCYDYPAQDTSDLPEKVLLDVVEQAFHVCGSSINFLFHGGEPLLRFNVIQQLVARATQLGRINNRKAIFSVQTNGSLFNEEVIRFLEEHDFNVGISVDGDDTVHNEFRVLHSGRGTFHLFEKACQQYGEFMKRRCGILTTVTSRNVSQLDQTAIYFNKLGFKTWDATLFDLAGRAQGHPELQVDPEEYCNSLDRLIDLIEDGILANMAVKPILRYLQNILSEERPDMCLPGNGPCGAATQLLSVSATGEIRACDIILDKNLLLGTVQSDSLASAYNSSAALRIRTRHALLSECRGCTWLGMCGGTCLGRSGMDVLNRTDCRIAKRMFETLIWRMKESDFLIQYYQKFSGDKNRAINI